MTILFNNLSISGIVTRIEAHLPPIITREENTVVWNFLSGLASAFLINIAQVNELYQNTFINQATGSVLSNNIFDLTKIYRRNGETDEDLRNRYRKYVFQYNVTKAQIREAVFDSRYGQYPVSMVSLNARSAYWGLEDNPAGSGATYFYDNIGENISYWGDGIGNAAFIGYIYLAERPTTSQKIDLCNIINRIKAEGVRIYLRYPLEWSTRYSTVYYYDSEESIYGI